MTTNDWRTDRPDVGRVIETRDGTRGSARSDSDATRYSDHARIAPLTSSWRYVDPPPERTAADLGTACAWVEVFARVVVPLGGHVWRTDEPEVGRWVIDRDGSALQIRSSRRARRWSEVSRRYPELYAWRYLEPHEVPT